MSHIESKDNGLTEEQLEQQEEDLSMTDRDDSHDGYDGETISTAAALELDEAEANVEEELLRLQLAVQTNEQRELSERRLDQRRLALAEKQRTIESLKQKLAVSSPSSGIPQPMPISNQSSNHAQFAHPLSTQASSSGRALDFGTPYTSSGADMYGRAISQPPKKVPRRQTLSGIDRMDAEDEVIIRVPMPDKFDGTGLLVASNDPSESVQVRLALGLDSIVDYIEYQCDSQGFVPSERQFVKAASRFLSGTAAGVYKDLKLIAQQEAVRRGDDVPALVTWPQLRKALELRFGRPQPGHQLIRSMSKLRQKANESVESYTVRFDSLHMELTRQNLATRDLSIALYLDGLLPALQE
ncbi:hypothetical protein HDU85_007590, partial [Gaertneriomyces sp. JEL0708]